MLNETFSVIFKHCATAGGLAQVLIQMTDKMIFNNSASKHFSRLFFSLSEEFWENKYYYRESFLSFQRASHINTKKILG